MILSVEDQLALIEKQYLKTFDRLRNSHYYASTEYKKPSYINETIKSALTFQRSVELLFDDVKKLSDDKTKYLIERCQKNVILIGDYLRDRPDGVCSYLDDYRYANAFSLFRNIRSFMYQFLEDVRLIYALRIYPIEEKMALKSKLSDYGFVEVIKCLDEAEDNLAMRKPEHFKDCIDRSREALEKTAASILVVEGKKSSGYFATDMGTLSNFGIFDKESKRLIEATYSYLSEVGAHGRAGEVTLGDAHYAMKETYMRIDIILKKYAAYSAGKKS